MDNLPEPDGLLGAKLASPEERAKVFRLAAYLPPALPPPPSVLDISGLVPDWGMLGNDAHADCTAAGAAHLSMVWTAQVDGRPVPITTDETLAFYNRFNGGSDNGATMIEALDAWRVQAIEPANLETGIHAYVSLDHMDHEMIRRGAWMFSGLYVAVALPLSARGQTVWDIVSEDGREQPGSWGGHAISIVGYDADGLTVVTWGALKRMTWAFWDRYVMEAYAVLTLAYDKLGDVATASGFNEAQLAMDLSQLNHNPGPPPTATPKPGPGPTGCAALLGPSAGILAVSLFAALVR